MKTLIPLILLASIAATPALAGEETRVAVSLAGLDLSNPRDAKTLEHRIAGAVESVCGSYAQVSYEEEARITACRTDLKAKLQPVIAQAVATHGITAVAAR